jgi:ribosomal protein L16 Arg81 hydroxylase
MTDGIRIVKVCAIVTTGSGRALSLHYDAKDLIIMQVEGSKRWRIYGPPVANPVIGMANETPPEGGPLFDTVLQPGDIAFMPAGYWHECDNGPDRSLHVLLLLDPPVDGTS